MRRIYLALLFMLFASTAHTPHAQDVRQYYLSPYIGDGSETNKFRPHGMDQAGAGCIDLRPNSAIATGFAICAAPVLPVQPGVISIAASSLSSLNAAKRTALSTALGVTITSTTPDALLPELLITHARTDGTRWKPLRPARDGKLHIWLGQQVYQQTAWLYPYVKDLGLVADATNFGLSLIEPPLAWATALAEDWNCANNVSLNCDLTWTEFNGTDWNITTNAARTVSTATQEARADSDLATDDHEVQVKVVTLSRGASTFVLTGPIARKENSATRTFYSFDALLQSSGELSSFELNKRVAGASTVLGTSTTDFVANDVLKVRADGDQISGFTNGVVYVGAVTDTAISGFTRGGINYTLSGASSPEAVLDDWAAVDVSARRSIAPLILE